MKKIDYIVYFDETLYLGISKKIKQTALALQESNFNASVKLIKPNGMKGVCSFIWEIIRSDADIIIVRSFPYLMSILAPALLAKRVQGKKIVIDIPTPNTTILNEIKTRTDIGFTQTILRQAIVLMSFPWALLPANRIIQYAPESKYFTFGVKNKTLLSANGIHVASVPISMLRPSWPADEFVFIGVASLADWHGFDRIIRGVADHLKITNQKARFIIVGDGDARNQLALLAKDLDITDLIEFKGFLSGVALDAEFERAHVAVASLGLYRKGLEAASDLKSREYTARGMPFVTAGYDLDFDPKPDFVFEVKNNNETAEILEIIDWYAKLQSKQCHPSKIREYAENHLDFSNKIKCFLVD